MSKKSLHGFTLVELSIVLLIIGMITTGIIGGRELLRQSELQSVISDFEKYKTAINTFEIAYGALPGDIKDATEYWTTAAGNGNGDRRIDYCFSVTQVYSDCADPRERFMAWQHLSLAEIIPGSYTGQPVGENAAILDVNVPSSKINGAGFSVLNSAVGVESPETKLYSNLNKNFLQFGGNTGVEDNTGLPVLTAPNARAIDLKIDDGKPDSGMLQPATPVLQPDCTFDDAGVIKYKLTYSGRACALFHFLE